QLRRCQHLGCLLGSRQIPPHQPVCEKAFSCSFSSPLPSGSLAKRLRDALASGRSQIAGLTLWSAGVLHFEMEERGKYRDTELRIAIHNEANSDAMRRAGYCVAGY